MILGALFVCAVISGWLATCLVRWGCFRFHILDIPNERSAHTQPMPTLGGIGLMVGTWGILGVWGLLGLSMPDFMWALLGASAVLCILVYDELRAMGRLAKLAVQMGATVCLVLGGAVLTHVTLPGDMVFRLGMWGFPVTVFLLVALQNLYNFMDGLDGFSGQEGVLVASFMGGVVVFFASDLLHFTLALSGATLGFWIWNKPPARIFMGDVGAHFLALCFGVVAIRGEGVGIPIWMTLLPLGAFLFDAIYTIGRRLFRGENITLAHRFHLYQRLQLMGWSPVGINGIYGVVTMMLGATALLMQSALSFLGWLGGAITGLLMLCGTVWLEMKWRAFDGRTQGKETRDGI